MVRDESDNKESEESTTLPVLRKMRADRKRKLAAERAAIEKEAATQKIKTE